MPKKPVTDKSANEQELTGIHIDALTNSLTVDITITNVDGKETGKITKPISLTAPQQTKLQNLIDAVETLI